MSLTTFILIDAVLVILAGGLAYWMAGKTGPDDEWWL